MATGDGITINPTGVEEIGAKLQAEADKNIAPQTAVIRQRLLWNPAFGGCSGSPAVQAAAISYHGQMRDAIVLLDNLVHNVNTMARAVQDAVDAYVAGDEISAMTMAQIIKGASAQIAQAEADLVQAEHEAARADRDSVIDAHRERRS